VAIRRVPKIDVAIAPAIRRVAAPPRKRLTTSVAAEEDAGMLATSPGVST